MFIRSNGTDLYVQQRGAGVPALVFLHYWGGSSRTWRHVIDALEGDFRTIAIDQRGWGRSAKPDSGYTLANLVADATGVISTLGLRRYILVGHSMGGKVAQLISAQRPNGLRGLVLVAPSPPSPLALPADVRRAMVSAYATRERIVGTVEEVLAANGLGVGDLEMVIEDSLCGAPAAIEAWPLATSQEDISTLVPRIEVPTIVISGEYDRVDPPDVLRRELLPRVRQAQLHLLPGVGHLLPLEAPAAVATLIHTFARAVMPVRTAKGSATGL